VATSHSDHLIGADDKRLRKSDTERFSRLLNGKIGRFCAFQYFIVVGYCAVLANNFFNFFPADSPLPMSGIDR
jgi:hypothetical protein